MYVTAVRAGRGLVCGTDRCFNDADVCSLNRNCANTDAARQCSLLRRQPPSFGFRSFKVTDPGRRGRQPQKPTRVELALTALVST
jgi:hypothetical protein